jgi:hypothetical protein
MNAHSAAMNIADGSFVGNQANARRNVPRSGLDRGCRRGEVCARNKAGHGAGHV